MLSLNAANLPNPKLQGMCEMNVFLASTWLLKRTVAWYP